ncbi:MAG TPA: alpha/beta hydrolase, partial [Streptosporangiaceae bacterium]|nr:alpha/beta hydrolase [Streptosporangiaceae bacterium]
MIAATAMAAALGGAAPAVASAATTQARTAAPSASSTTSSITWGTCTETDLQQAGAQCGYLSVPLNYSHPSGTKIKIAVSRILHTSTAADYRGIILTNPGGPGGSGL